MKKDKTTISLFVALSLIVGFLISDIIKSTHDALFRRAAGESDYERKNRVK